MAVEPHVLGAVGVCLDFSCAPAGWTAGVGSARVNHPVDGIGRAVGFAIEVFPPGEFEAGVRVRVGVLMECLDEREARKDEGETS